MGYWCHSALLERGWTLDAAYLRVSTHKQDLASQQHAIETWLQKQKNKRKLADILVYEDIGLSGSRDDRPSLQRMLADAKQGLITRIIVYRLDRLSRNANSAISILLELDSLGIEFVSISQSVLNLSKDNPFRRTMLAAFSEIAELEREAIITRIRSGLSAAKKRGVKLGAPAKLDEALREKVQTMRKEGHSLRKIASELGVSAATVHRATVD